MDAPPLAKFSPLSRTSVAAYLLIAVAALVLYSDWQHLHSAVAHRDELRQREAEASARVEAQRLHAEQELDSLLARSGVSHDANISKLADKHGHAGVWRAKVKAALAVSEPAAHHNASHPRRKKRVKVPAQRPGSGEGDPEPGGLGWYTRPVGVLTQDALRKKKTAGDSFSRGAAASVPGRAAAAAAPGGGIADHSGTHPILAIGDTEWASTPVDKMLERYAPAMEGTWGAVPPLPSRTDWTRLVPRPVLTGHVSSLAPY